MPVVPNITTQEWQDLADFANTQGNDENDDPHTATSFAAEFPNLTDAQKRRLRLLALAAAAA